jgi:hypothetical protein
MRGWGFTRPGMILIIIVLFLPTVFKTERIIIRKFVMQKMDFIHNKQYK